MGRVPKIPARSPARPLEAILGIPEPARYPKINFLKLPARSIPEEKYPKAREYFSGIWSPRSMYSIRPNMQ